ncbi:phosphatidylglycerophosphate synthase [Microbacterium foliorum]|jgi:phosphatidylglycerophosphate synthase|uniref:Phosphatidylglycerophosphate synthase n=1 Tax=Microbacterium foliorum TaxID=104336 RepID=A0ABU1HV98_9MICO|nr:CDP-alcohol phosphatidyltransferase family protein [Microbacterium foliorum]MDR6143973.1 phosphatidylglycerophosphate synthase [Microbacterium foliorum]
MSQQTPGVREALASLRAAQKSSSGAPAYSRFVNRPIGRIFAAVAFAWGRTPDQVTAVSALFTFAGIALIALAPPTLLTSLLIVIMLVLGYALDSADGQLARLRGGGSPRGEWLDHMVDATKMATIHIAVLICWWRFYDVAPPMLLIPLGFQVVASVFFFGVILTELIRRVGSAGTASTAGFRNSPIYALIVLPADYGLLILVFATLWVPWLFITLYSALLAVNALILLASVVRWHRSLGPIGARDA